ncbi:hypothetical protein IC607_11600 [Cellulomonas sp. JH27-2]|uniref:hypothetical protein n=1 Tax=Cellulomonas sp. JH27-2 TaxID=2774139 RepID=UPI001780F9D8|nr:hypothetical protein [Cellulomonas sp. JH27-2]MBD8059609.1 hypothetical protein [Cellulomonas sp. JH27-2]
MSSSGEAAPARRWIVVAVVAAVVVVGAIVFLATRGSSGGGGAAATTSASRTPTTGIGSAAGTATSTSTAPSTVPSTASPGATPSGSPRGTSTAEATSGSSPRATAAPGARPTDPPVALKATVEPTKGVTARLAKLESVTGVADLPGEVGGPALRVTVEVTNATDDDVDLTGAVVVLYQGEDRAPAIELTKPGGSPLPASVAAGKSVTGVYVFNVPVAERNPVEVEVDLAAEVPVVVFRGDARPIG